MGMVLAATICLMAPGQNGPPPYQFAGPDDFVERYDEYVEYTVNRWNEQLAALPRANRRFERQVAQQSNAARGKTLVLVPSQTLTSPYRDPGYWGVWAWPMQVVHVLDESKCIVQFRKPQSRWAHTLTQLDGPMIFYLVEGLPTEGLTAGKATELHYRGCMVWDGTREFAGRRFEVLVFTPEEKLAEAIGVAIPKEEGKRTKSVLAPGATPPR